ncbi:MAG: hypothetical protein JRD47_06795 [Deltaproteobacteria bacterium]|nr:hypothetical protein [Deltaproteobacteria bacterium]
MSSKSEIPTCGKASTNRQNPKSKILSPVYFPFTHIPTTVVQLLSSCFDRITVYQPVSSTPHATLQPWIDNGFLDFRTPFLETTDKTALMAKVKEWKTWALLNPNTDFAYLKAMKGHIAPVDPVTQRTVSQIKGTLEKTVEESGNRDLALQLFLLLAQDFDQQSMVLQEQLAEIGKGQQALQASFLIDNPEDANNLVSEMAFGQPQEDLGAFSTEKRMTAWSHLFQKSPAEPVIFLTNSPSSHAFLLDKIEESVEIFDLTLPYPQDPSPATTPQKDYLNKLLYELLTNPWNDDLKKRAEKASDDMKAMVSSGKRAMGRPEETASFRWSLLPNIEPCARLNRCCGLNAHSSKKGPVMNTLVGLFQDIRS